MIYSIWELSGGLPLLLTLILVQILALGLDMLLGEPSRFHPLVGFGRYSDWLQQRFNSEPQHQGVGRGLLAWIFAVVPPVILLTIFLIWVWQLSVFIFWMLNILVLYFTLGLKSLGTHGRLVAEPLASGDLSEARVKVSWLVSRQTGQMDAGQVSKACIESLLENGNDAVFGALFWFLVAGAPGAMLYRLANTLDASWGYRNDKFRFFGWWSARTDDWLNWPSARLSALCYSLCGDMSVAFADWKKADQWRRNEGRGFASPNAGIVMASGAGALNLGLGGTAVYQGVEVFKPCLGSGRAPTPEDIAAATGLLHRSVCLFIAFQFLGWFFIWLL